jgi:hypothetical protein
MMPKFERVERPTGDADPITILFDAIATVIVARNPEIGEEEFAHYITKSERETATKAVRVFGWRSPSSEKSKGRGAC